ncbi:MAG: alpha/beta hydrolase [Polaromonas sp.]|uniref:alpha/beta fold hydrolase n=1 Tax=Polaromonas sp. TaxID=1869339 RepID=UPI00272F8846|nr:alpha/beta hydrolase [Polaromonas sp.]MDP1739637.1 alpha/beta hydrolase [Polaromonas sp.]MDP1955269.1 alpha/beta hydrolase [Polaromonas sp.]MDP3357636.1 alpha/beta hydrolase [Polaromonas sp.]MDP3751126.1 alpha/beta hydrolase [Polaromonas sp.]
MKISANGIDIEIEDSGGAGPAVLLIMGLGMQLVAWPPAMVQALVDAGYRVIRLDNRDIGLSQKFDHLGKPNLVWASIKYRLGLTIQAPYSLHDMAADALAVLDALQVDKAHVVGVSMGGMIAQRVALAAPARVLSLTSIMSSSGARGLPQAKPRVMRVLLSRPAGSDAGAVINHYVRLFKAIGSPGFPVDEGELRKRVALGVKRSFHPAGVLRQMVAVAADSRRAAELARLRVPTLVIHGKADPLVPFACGEDTARRIPGASLVGIEGMGHDLPPGVVERMLAPLIAHLHTDRAAA